MNDDNSFCGTRNRKKKVIFVAVVAAVAIVAVVTVVAVGDFVVVIDMVLGHGVGAWSRPKPSECPTLVACAAPQSRLAYRFWHAACA